MSRRRKEKTIRLGKPILEIGDTVLIGGQFTAPYEWWFGKVLWFSIENNEVLVEQYGIAGMETHRQMHGINYLRAVGSSQELSGIQRRASEAMQPHVAAIREAEAKLHEAKVALLDHLAEWAKGDPIRDAGAGI
ncbi:MAG: hypothetical protein DI629_03550 [Mesorhizobium amorphae]|nr:MAG: hypothetical protein DI629_03550 [Mesorhizobium amorphae]